MQPVRRWGEKQQNIGFSLIEDNIVILYRNGTFQRMHTPSNHMYVVQCSIKGLWWHLGLGLTFRVFLFLLSLPLLSHGISWSSPLPHHRRYCLFHAQQPPTGDSSSLPTSFNVSHHFHTPMDRTSYLCWRNQFQIVLDIHDLLSIVIDSPPPSSLKDGKVNPAYTYWKKADQLVLSWIKAMVTTSVQTILLRCNTTVEAPWTLSLINV